MPARSTLVTPRREHTGDRQLDAMQRESGRVAQSLRNIPFLDGRLLDGGKGDGSGPGVSIGTGSTTLSHALGRPVRGFIVVDLRADARVWRPTSQPSDPTRLLALQASAAVTAKVWVW